MTDPQETAVTDLAVKPTTESEATETELDARLLAEAQRHLGTSIPNVAVNEALRRLVEQEREKRRAARARMHRRYEEGVFDFTRLEAAEE